MDRRKAAAGLAAGLLALAGVACGSNEGLDALTSAADVVRDAGSARTEGTMTMEARGQAITIELEGEFDFDEEIGSMTVRVDAGEALPGLTGPLEMIVDGRYAYMRGEAIAPVLQGKEWGRVDLTETGAGTQLNQDPTQFLDWLRGATGDVEEVGEEDVRGTPTTHFQAVLSAEEIIANAPDDESGDVLREQLEAAGDIGPMPVDVWIDEDGLPRGIDIEVEAEGDQTGVLFSDISMELYDYGVEVDIEPPSDFQDISNAAG